MKQLLIIVSLFILTSSHNYNSIDKCFPEKGIKTALITGKIKNSSKTQKLRESREIEFNKNGQPLSIRNSSDIKEEIKREYKDGKLQLILRIYKKLPDFYFDNELESLMKNATIVTDTSFVLAHNKNGRPSKIKTPDGTIQNIEYEGKCEIELATTISPKGDTIQQFKSTFKDGVLTETTWTAFKPIKSSRTSKYFGYKFNKNGHWIKRNYTHQGKATITETRKLTYY